MALPSQMQSNPARGRHVYRRRRRRRGPALLAALVVIGIGIWLVLRVTGSDDPVAETPAVAADPPRQEAEVVEEIAPVRRGVPPSPPLPPASTTATRQWTLEPETTDVATAAPPAPVRDVAPPPASVTSSPPDRLDGPGGPLRLGQSLVEEGKLVEARRVLTQALASDALTETRRREARSLLELISEELVFSPRVYPGDPWASAYEVERGDSLSRIVSRENLMIDWRFLQKINALSRPEAVRSGQSIKVVRGPFHAEVDKKNHRLDLFLGDGPDRVFVRSFTVGLGELGSTPLGRFRVQRGRKLVNPTWTNPRTGEFFPADDPENPIGEYWVGLEGIDEVNRDERGFGIHGTIEPDSIGTDSSMGCIRLREGEIDLIYAALAEDASTIDVRP